MKGDADMLVRECEVCQKHCPYIHIHAADMIAISSSCPLARWGIDIVGPFVKVRGSKQFLVVAVNYFTKWVDAELLLKITKGRWYISSGNLVAGASDYLVSLLLTMDISSREM